MSLSIANLAYGSSAHYLKFRSLLATLGEETGKNYERKVTVHSRQQVAFKAYIAWGSRVDAYRAA